jgi:hypothetical protein
MMYGGGGIQRTYDGMVESIVHKVVTASQSKSNIVWTYGPSALCTPYTDCTWSPLTRRSIHCLHGLHLEPIYTHRLLPCRKHVFLLKWAVMLGEVISLPIQSDGMSLSLHEWYVMEHDCVCPNSVR